MKRIFSTIFLSAVTLAAPSWAITINPLAPASGYNVFVEGDSTITKGHLDGGLVTGGNLNVKGTMKSVPRSAARTPSSSAAR